MKKQTEDLYSEIYGLIDMLNSYGLTVDENGEIEDKLLENPNGETQRYIINNAKNMLEIMIEAFKKEGIEPRS